MNEELEKRLEKYLETLESTITQASDFAIEQTPLVVQEYLSWIFWSNIFLFALNIIIIIFCIFLMFKLRFVMAKNMDTDIAVGFQILCFIMSSVGIILGFIFSAVSLYYAIKVAVAPRVVLLEKISELINGTG